MLDLMSGGRIFAGMIRGGGPEQIINDFNPVYNRERFEEAHDLIIKAWTTPGPFRWDGEHYQVRVVNPWVLPLQEPHPRILVPGVSSPETIAFAAQPRLSLPRAEHHARRDQEDVVATTTRSPQKPGTSPVRSTADT